jgi:SAM-dependent methyltransferase
LQKDELTIFRSPLLPDEDIRFIGESNGDDIEHGLLCAGNSVVGYVEHGIPSFTVPHQSSFDSDVDKIRSENWVGRSWEKWSDCAVEENDLSRIYDSDIPRLLAETDGLILEIAAGPGAGFTPGILLKNPEARILLNDFSIGILRLQKAHATSSCVGPNILFAAWDATEHALRPETIVAASSAVGICNVSNPLLAIEATFEALVPGGRLYMIELARDTERIVALPEWIRRKYGLYGSWMDDLERTGFRIESHALISGNPVTDPEDGGLVKDAIESGHTIYRDWDVIVARKPT